jgi:hypothetical protein
VLLGGLLGVAVLVAGCGETDDPALAELRADPMATVAPPDATLVTADDVARSSGGIIFGSKPRSTRVLRSFAPDDSPPDRLLADLQQAATDSGWQLQPGTVPVSGAKEFGFGRGQISIYTNTFVQPAQVVVVLEPLPVSGGST